MSLDRILEPEIMDDSSEAESYDMMDFSQVNRDFVEDLWKYQPLGHDFLDLGTGTALIPIELCRRLGKVGRVMASDASKSMLELARYRVEVASLTERVQLHYGDAKKLPFANHFFDCVISNSLIHHLPEPHLVFTEVWRVLRPSGLLFFRDLLRPTTHDQVESIIQRHAINESMEAQKLFRQSLHAALTIDEVATSLHQSHIKYQFLEATSDRHWTLVARKEA